MKTDYEKLGIKVSIVGSLLLSLSAIVMALIVHSQAILLDGLYTFVTMVLAIISLKVVNLVKVPETSNRPFGYMALEPFLNFIKCLVILTLLLAFLFSNIQELIQGGRVILLNTTAIYTVICLFIYCFVILFLKKCERHEKSSILMVEIKNWKIDTWLTFGIVISLLLAIFICKLGYTQILPYIDPVIVILLIIASVPVPLKIFIQELRKLLLISKENNTKTEVRTQIKPIIEKYGLKNIKVWSLKSGRTLYLFIYLDLEDEETTITYLDGIRTEIFHKLSEIYPMFWADIIFTRISPTKPFPFKNKTLS